MTDAIITALGAIVVAAIAAGGGALEHVYRRLDDVEDELGRVRKQNRELWTWARKLLDLYYLHRGPGAPDPDPMPKEE